jgi:hypothetical protein
VRGRQANFLILLLSPSSHYPGLKPCAEFFSPFGADESDWTSASDANFRDF